MWRIPPDLSESPVADLIRLDPVISQGIDDRGPGECGDPVKSKRFIVAENRKANLPISVGPDDLWLHPGPPSDQIVTWSPGPK